MKQTENLENSTTNRNTIDRNTIDRNTIDRKEFIRQVGMSFGAIVLMNCLQSCGDGSEIPDPNAGGSTGKLDFTIDLNTAAYTSLKTKGNSVVVRAQNVIIARVNDANATWIAVDSRCTHQQTTVDYRPATNDFLCPNHLSIFTATGAVTRGPATSPLTRYSTSFDATNNTLRIFA